MTTTDVPAGPPATPQGPDEPGRRRPTWVIVAVAAVLALLVGLAVVLVTAGDEPLPGIAREPALDATGIEVVDYQDSDDGEVVDLVPADGEVTLLYFGFLNCPDVCPTTLADVMVALDGMPVDQASRVDVALLTVDPERDTGDDIREYLGQFYDRLPNGQAALRADAGTSLEEVTERFQVYYEIEEHEPGAERYDVGHSAITYVIDDTGEVVRELPFGATPEDFARVIEATLAG